MTSFPPASSLPGSVYRFDWTEKPPEEIQGGVVAVGNFDGVHRGHAQLIEVLCRRARQRSCPAVAVFFDPHPLQLLRPNQFRPVLTTAQERARLLLEAGVTAVVILATTRELLQLSARQFFDEVLVRRLAAVAIVEGHDFGFGRQREGNNELLKKWCAEKNIGFEVVPAFCLVDKQPVSSSQVRSALERGDVSWAKTLLGRPYRLAGRVGTGQRRGQKLGFPTANLEQVTTMVPRDGVYAARALTERGSYPAAVNIGPNPTFHEVGQKIEAHLLDFDGNLYEQPLALDFIERLRDIQTFDSAEQLVQQLRKDVARVRSLIDDN